jgi:short-subunit dehydrogenase
MNKNKTVFITGASAGIGRETAILFANKGWQVIASMRNPEKDTVLNQYKNIKLVKLDVLDETNIKDCVHNVLLDYGKIDVLINNAGLGVFGVFEAATMEQIYRQYDTNVFGTMRVMKAFLPSFRKEKNGVIINLSSGVGKIAVPYMSLYNATKFSIEGLTESLQYELNPLGIRVKLVLPGNIKTNFFNALITTDVSAFPDYQNAQKLGIESAVEMNTKGAEPEMVAKVIYKAATDNSNRLRYLAGKDVKLFLFMRKLLPDRLFFTLIKSQLKK